jgi:hypothetical protein
MVPVNDTVVRSVEQSHELGQDGCRVFTVLS